MAQQRLCLAAAAAAAAAALLFRLVGADYNFTYSMAHRCKEHISSNGYHYSPFYRVSSSRSLPPDTLLEMHIAILAASNGHVLLSPVPSPELSDPVYEIVLGGGANKFSELRRMQKRFTKTSERTVGILSPIHFHAFWIKITDEGSVEVGREGESLPLLHYLDPDPLSINYFSFASWTNVEAKFLYDCPVAGDDAKQNATESELVTPSLTTAQRLKVAVVGARSPLAPPAPRVTVRLALDVAALHYDAAACVLHTLLAVVLTWRDEQIAWDPDKYNGTADLLFRQSEIWKPEFYVHNSVDIGALEAKTSEPIYLANSGAATLHVRSAVASWCEDARGASAWPRDHYRCRLYIGPWEMHEQIHMEILESSAVELQESTYENSFISNEWELVSAGYALNASDVSPYSGLTCASGENQHTDSLLVLELRVRRRGAHSIVLYTPLLAVMVFVLMSLWWAGPEHVQHRVNLYCALSLLLCALLCYADAAPTSPGRAVPSILILYQVVLLSTLLALLVQLLSTLPLAGQYADCLPGLVSSRLLGFLCCLPPAQTYKSFTSRELEDDSLEPHPGGDPGAASQAERRPPAVPARRALTGALDRLTFAVYLALYTIMLACHY